jgi:hypothetical protein
LDNGVFGQEIGDECSFLIFIPNGTTHQALTNSTNSRA